MANFDYTAFEAKVLEHLRASASGLDRVEIGARYDNAGQWPFAWVLIGSDEGIENDINGQRSFEIPMYIGISGQTRDSVNDVIRNIGVLWYANANALKAELFALECHEVTIVDRFRPNASQPELGNNMETFTGGVQVNFLCYDSYITP